MPRSRARQRWGVRKRAILASTSMVFLALIAGGAILLVQLQQALVQAASDQTVTTARDVASKYTSLILPVAHSVIKDLVHKGQEVQIVTPKRAVVAAAHEEYLEHSLVKVVPLPGTSVTYPTGSPKISADQNGAVVTSIGFTNNGEPYAVNVMAEIEIQEQSVRTVGLYLLIGLPILMLLVGGMTWALVGGALHPVERIREQVDGIRRSGLSQRVDVPPTADEISRLAATMNVMLGRLEASDAAQRMFVSDASHELRSPLSTLTATLEIAASDASGQTWRDMQGVLLSQAERMRRLVDDLLTLAKADDQGVLIRPTEQDLDDLIDSEVRELRGVSQHRIIVHAQPIRLDCDGQRISQVLRNLLDNADRLATSRISLTCHIKNENVVIDIDDDGPLIPPADRTRVFERFVRLDDSRSRDSGNSGLGLAIAAEFIKAHHGTIEATESPEGLCRFRLTLPLNADSRH